LVESVTVPPGTTAPAAFFATTVTKAEPVQVRVEGATETVRVLMGVTVPVAVGVAVPGVVVAVAVEVVDGILKPTEHAAVLLPAAERVNCLGPASKLPQLESPASIVAPAGVVTVIRNVTSPVSAAPQEIDRLPSSFKVKFLSASARVHVPLVTLTTKPNPVPPSGSESTETVNPVAADATRGRVTDPATGNSATTANVATIASPILFQDRIILLHLRRV
jgi:hypothetical protein